MVVSFCSVSCGRIKNFFPYSQALGCYLKKLIRINEIHTLLEAHDLWRNETKRIIRAGGTGVGQMLCLADIHLYIFCLSCLSYNHTGINLLARPDKQNTALLCIIKTIGDTLSVLKCNDGALLAVLDIAFLLLITVEDRVDDTISLRIGHEFASETDQTS